MKQIAVGDLEIRVTGTREEGFVAVEQLTGMFGEGDDQAEALSDVLRSLYFLLTDLEEHRERLSSPLAAQWRALTRSLPRDFSGA